jgi:phosphohistidine phosphatase
MADQTRSLYLVRHAPAELRGRAWPDDALRPLTRDGRQRMRAAVAGLVALGVEFDLILTSPYVRARQTAAILTRAAANPSAVREVDWLQAGSSPDRIARGLKSIRRGRRLALVGHEPDLGVFAAWLAGTPTPIPFKKGAVCRFDAAHWPPRPPLQLVWFAPPKILRAAAT